MEYFILLFIFLVGPIFYLRTIKEKTWNEIKEELLPKNKGLKKELTGSFTLFGALLLGFFLIAITMFFFQLGTGIEINDMEKVEEVVNKEINNNFFGFIGLIIIVLFAEEFFFRSFLVKRIGIFFSTLIFSFFHIGYGSIMEIIGVFFLGLLLAYWFKKNNSLIQNYLGHLLYDILAIILYVII